MLEQITWYFALSVIGGLALSMWIFTKWDFPARMKRKFRLETRVKAVLFVLVQGMIIAVVVTLVMELLSIADTVEQILIGLAVGFNCAVLIDMLRLDGGKDNSAPGKSGGSANKRSKG